MGFLRSNLISFGYLENNVTEVHVSINYGVWAQHQFETLFTIKDCHVSV